jgi:hypothetical protein
LRYSARPLKTPANTLLRSDLSKTLVGTSVDEIAAAALIVLDIDKKWGLYCWCGFYP